MPLAPTLGVLVAARALQGAGGALLVPGSLAIIEASVRPDDRGAAIGAWSGLSGVATALGPLAGGLLITAVSWRLIFVLNLPVAVVVLWAIRHLPESSDPDASRRVDVAGALSAVLGLAGVTYSLTDGPSASDPVPAVIIGLLGALALASFVLVERRSRHPMLPLGIFSSRQFTVSNVLTFVVYGALGVVLFLLAVQLQTVLGYSALEAGAALLPITALMLTLSARSGRLAQRIGPRLPMTLGPVVIALGLLLMVRIGPGAAYLTVVLPSLVVFGMGLVVTVAPLTTTVLGAVGVDHSGVASGVNNAVARVAGLLAVALVPPLVGLTGSAYTMPAVFTAGFHSAVLLAAGLCAAGAVLAGVGIANPGPPRHRRRTADLSCPLDAPTLRPRGRAVPS